MWVIGCHVPVDKKSIKLLKKKKKLLPWGVMPITDWELHSSSTLVPENNRFPLLYEPLILPEEASPPVNGSFL